MLGNYAPEDGGGFTFVEGIVREIGAISASLTEDISFSIFCTKQAYSHVAESCPNVEVNIVPVEFVLRKYFIRLCRIFPKLKNLIPVRSNLEIVLGRQGIMLAWFVGGHGEVVDIPYIATVWDIQHRTHPWFPEVSANGEWNRREAFYSTYLKRASSVITGTKVGAEELSRFYQIEWERILILPHPTPEFAREKNELSEIEGTGSDLILGSKFFLYPAQFWPHKNHINLIKGFKKFLLDSGLEYKLVLVGSDKGNRGYVQEVVKKLEMADDVVFLGFVDRQRLLKLYKSATALVYASFSGPENLPPLEAFALSCPVCNSDFPGAREQLKDAAIYFDPMNTDSIASELQRIVQDERLRAILVFKGYEIASSWKSKDYLEMVVQHINRIRKFRASWGAA